MDHRGRRELDPRRRRRLGREHRGGHVRYWSSQPWTEGIGVSEMVIDDSGAGFDPTQIYVARAACR